MQALKQIFDKRGERIRYKLGQPLCEGHSIPGQVLLIERGIARLLGEQDPVWRLGLQPGRRSYRVLGCECGGDSQEGRDEQCRWRWRDCNSGD